MSLYLIAHKVRGNPAFDIAERMDMGDDEVWWIITTSGHRAYPYWELSFESLGVHVLPDGNWGWGYNDSDGSYKGLVSYPQDDHPDHYPGRTIPITLNPDDAKQANDLLNRLGLLKPKEPIKRRV